MVLLESDKYGNLVPSLAEGGPFQKDGLTYTYKLREGSEVVYLMKSMQM